MPATHAAQAFVFLGALLRRAIFSEQNIEKHAQALLRGIQQKQVQTSLFDNRVSFKISAAHQTREFPAVLGTTNLETKGVLSRGQNVSYGR